MTIAGRREPRFSDITKVRGLGTKFYAMSGKRQTVIIAQNNNGLAEVVSETPDLGAAARDVTNDPAVPNTLYVLTDTGVQFVDASPAVPVFGAKITFDPGDGRWILMSSTLRVVAPIKGGVAIRDVYGAEISGSTPAGVESCVDAAIGSDDVLYVVDQQRAKIHVWRITTSKATYISSFAAKNCRGVVKVVLDATANILFVQCKHRIVGFNVSPAGTADEAISVTLRQDYGSLKAEYTDMAKIGPNKYWIGVDADSALNPAPEFYGRPYGAWDTPNSLLFTAFPDVSLFAASNVVPYVGEIQIPPVPGIPDVPVIVVPPPIPVIPPPPVVTPAAPVITSSLTATVTEDTVFNYVITATGAGPIYYDVISPPIWLTGINHVTGAISGIPADPGTVNVTIRATNAGGSDTETLVVTVTLAIGNNTVIDMNSGVADLDVDAAAIGGALVYVCGAFTTVWDRNGSYTRNRLACLNASTGLWTSWNPNSSQAINRLHIHTDGTIVVGCNSGGSTIGGTAVGWLARLSPSTGAVLSAPSQPDAIVYGMASSGSDLYICGGFGTVGGQARGYAARLSGGTTVDGWDPRTSGGVRLGLQMFSIFPSGGGVYIAGQSRIDSPTGFMSGVVRADAATGIFSQMSQGGGNSTNITGRMFVGAGGVVVPNHMTQIQNLPDLTLAASARIAVMSGVGISTGLAPVLTGPDPFKYVVSGMQRSDGTLLIGGSIGSMTSVNGDGNLRGMAAITTSGATVPGFSFATRFTGQSNPYAVAMKAITGDAIAVATGSAATYDGTTATGLLIINPYTGARY